MESITLYSLVTRFNKNYNHKHHIKETKEIVRQIYNIFGWAERVPKCKNINGWFRFLKRQIWTVVY